MAGASPLRKGRNSSSERAFIGITVTLVVRGSDGGADGIAGTVSSASGAGAATATGAARDGRLAGGETRRE